MATTTTSKTKPAKPAKAEAKLESVSVRFHDKTYVIPRTHIDDLELFEALEDSRYIVATRGFLGQEQWDAFKDAHRVDGRVPMTLLHEFLDVMNESLGNQSASSDS